MISVRNRGRIILAGTMLLIVLLVLGMASVIFPDTNGDSVHKVPTPMTTPGLLIYGTVQDSNGSGLSDVEIYRSYASYPGVVIATTGADGYYQSDFAMIPGDEMVNVWALSPGMVFEPESYYWRHYYGYEQTECNFTMQVSWEQYLPVIIQKPEK
jgi:hypothetical protein